METSPQGTPTVGRGPRRSPRTARGVDHRSTIRPSSRTRTAVPTPSSIVFTVPRLAFERPPMDRRRLGGAGQPRRDVRGQAVAGHHVEAGTRQQHDAGRPRLRIQARQGLEDVDLAGDVAVVDARREAGPHHRSRRWPRTDRPRAARHVCHLTGQSSVPDRTPATRARGSRRAGGPSPGCAPPARAAARAQPRARRKGGPCSRSRRRSGSRCPFLRCQVLFSKCSRAWFVLRQEARCK